MLNHETNGTKKGSTKTGSLFGEVQTRIKTGKRVWFDGSRDLDADADAVKESNGAHSEMNLVQMAQVT